jgi:hypothetical protein
VEAKALAAHHASADRAVGQGRVQAEQTEPQDEQADRQHHVAKAATAIRRIITPCMLAH